MIKFIARLFYSIRPSACLGTSLFAVASVETFNEIPFVLTVFIAVFFGSASCFLINDLFDRKKDLLNEKNRPIAAGTISVNGAIFSTVVFASLYLALSYLLGSFQLFICIITLLIFFAYGYINSRFGLLANVVVAASVCLSFLFGAGEIPPIADPFWLILTSIFFVIIVREILLDGLDTKGDLLVGKTSLPLKVGERKIIWVIISGYIAGSIPLMFLINQANLSLVIVASILSLWAPLWISLNFRQTNWMLYNIRSSHLFFAFIITALVADKF